SLRRSRLHYLFPCSPHHRHLHSFPTRRSSDLTLSGERQGSLAYALFDLLHLDGVDVSAAPLVERKELLKELLQGAAGHQKLFQQDRKSTRLNSSHVKISYAVFCLKKKTKIQMT